MTTYLVRQSVRTMAVYVGRTTAGKGQAHTLVAWVEFNKFGTRNSSLVSVRLAGQTGRRICLRVGAPQARVLSKGMEGPGRPEEDAEFNMSTANINMD